MSDWPFVHTQSKKKSNVIRSVSCIAMATLIPSAIIFGAFNSHACWVMDADPRIEAELLGDMSHIVMDFLSLLNPDTLVLRAASVIGRLLFLESDFVLDGKISPDDLIFQSGTLTASTILLAKSTLPFITTWLRNDRKIATFRDKRAYQTMFRPVGVSWLQYRILFGTGALEWIDHVPPKTVLSSTTFSADKRKCQEEEHHVHWLYQGNAEIQYKGSTGTVQYIDMVQGKSLYSPGEMGLLAPNTKFIELLQKETRRKSKKTRSERSDDSNAPIYLSQASTVTIGFKGASVLKFNMLKLIRLTKNDDKLDSSLLSLFLKGMQRKLSSLLAMKLDTVQEISSETGMVSRVRLKCK
jgi:hypothetical protein